MDARSRRDQYFMKISRSTLVVLFALVVLLLSLSAFYECKVVDQVIEEGAETSSSRKLMVLINDYGGSGGDYVGPPDDGNYYRRQGDVPSPGVGH
ncbi:hypothetical protein Dsin_001971 [Dipteronia sinensis]|uniref:Uncharacterized protein n=1 Tax=Dipteronia sinensis TaxID=43782 RepID=A0AAE0B6D0_9ROSI|nr:hypothetical protein Dsin_001971 [Dipteronia sinensis]